MITHPGDDEYKPAVQQAQITIPVRNEEGTPQQIMFEPVADVKRNVKSIQLHASSNSDLPVRFYVESGPAYMNGNRLIITPIPPKTSYPVKVTVAAWQYGRSLLPKVQTAEPVSIGHKIYNLFGVSYIALRDNKIRCASYRSTPYFIISLSPSYAGTSVIILQRELFLLGFFDTHQFHFENQS